jgi:ribonuclease VapC
MVLDTSVIVAILRAEPDAISFARAIARADIRRLSAASYVEAGAVIDGSRDPVASRRLDELLEAMDAAIEPVTPSQARIARAAYRDYGRGSGHPAGLNYGDCFAYALAREVGEPLLFQGDDFHHTDVTPARLDPAG